VKILRLLDLREQQEQQAKGIFSQNLAYWKLELGRLDNLKKELLQVEGLLHEHEKLRVNIWQQYAKYLTKLRDMIKTQKQQVEKKRGDMEKARLHWEKCRTEKEKMEVLLKKRAEIKREREKTMAQNELDEIGRAIILRGIKA